MTWVALHGFTQRGSMWQQVAAGVGGDWRCPDLPGHGGQPVRSWDDTVAWVAAVAGAAPPPRRLVGYSMGGRLALAAALGHPGLVQALALLSASPGIADPEARRGRREEDGRLADRIEAVGPAAFLDEWLGRAWFGGGRVPPAEWRRAEHAARSGSTARGLSGALRSLGQGVQPWLGDRLGELPMPVLLVAGADDVRYAALAMEMGRATSRATVALLPAAGHALVGEKSAEVAALLASWASGE